MVKQFAKYLKFGNRVESTWSGEMYFLVQKVEDGASVVDAVREDNWNRYLLLRTWNNNHVGLTEEQKKEMSGYVESLKISTITPRDKVRFITSGYDTKFEVETFHKVLVDGKPRRVIFLDPYHFAFEGGTFYHICEFAELCERNGVVVEPLVG